MNGDELTEAFINALGTVTTVEHDGIVYMDVDTITNINIGIARAIDPTLYPDFEPLPKGFIGGVVFTLDMYRRIHAGILSRHAADLVPDHIPDGMDDVV